MTKKILLIIFLLLIFIPGYADLRSAVDSLKLEIEKNPDDYLLHFKLGSCYYSLRKHENALKEFNRTLEINKGYFAAKFKTALSYFFLDSFKIAKEKLEELKEPSPDNKFIYRWLGWTYRYLGEYNKMSAAFERYNKLIEKEFFKNPTNRDGDLSHACGMGYALLGRSEDAANYYRIVIKRYRHPSELKMKLAMLYQKMGNSHQANKWFNKSLKDLSAYYNYYNARLKRNEFLSYKSSRHYRFGEFGKAIAIVDTLIQEKEDDYVDIYNLGVFRIASGDAKGVDDIKKACDMDTTGLVQAIYNAINAIRVDSLLKAESSLKQKIPGLSRSGIAQGLLACTLEKLGKDAEAKKCWFRCHCRLPLGTDVESMREFVDKFIKTIKP